MKINIGAFFSYFMRGLLLVIPFAVTGYIISFALQKIDGIMGVKIPGLGIAILVVAITLMGYLGSTLLVRSLFDFTERWMGKLPLVGLIYSSLKEFTSAFVGKEQKFDKPVLVLLNKEAQIHKLGFITQSDLAAINLAGKVAVYVPHSYNFSGDLFLMPKESIIALNISSSEIMTFIISGGVTGVQHMEIHKTPSIS